MITLRILGFFRNCRELTQSDQIIASGTLDALKSTHAGHRFEKFGLVVDSLDVFVIADFLSIHL